MCIGIINYGNTFISKMVATTLSNSCLSWKYWKRYLVTSFRINDIVLSKLKQVYQIKYWLKVVGCPWYDKIIV